MDEDITLQEILRRLADENPNIYPETPSWMSPFTRGGIGLKEYGPPPESFYPNQIGIPHSGPQVAVENYEAQNPVKEEEPKADDDDYLNQLMMAALMKGGKGGKMGQLAGASGGGISFGDAWSMRAPWEKDYRYLS